MHIDGTPATSKARYDPAPRPDGIQAVLCHPHPLYRGSMHDAVLDCLTKVGGGAAVHQIAGADHFFSGCFDTLAAELRRIVSSS